MNTHSAGDPQDPQLTLPTFTPEQSGQTIPGSARWLADFLAQPDIGLIVSGSSAYLSLPYTTRAGEQTRKHIELARLRRRPGVNGGQVQVYTASAIHDHEFSSGTYPRTVDGVALLPGAAAKLQALEEQAAALLRDRVTHDENVEYEIGVIR